MLGLNQDAAGVAALRTAVGQVMDPELHRTLAELGMVREVTLSRTGVGKVEVALTTAGCPMTRRLTADVTAAGLAVPGLTDIQVLFTTMSERERRDLADTFLATRPARRGSPAKAIYAVASGKGGVGKSSVAANIAVSLAQQGQRVGLLDADVWGYSVPQLFGVRHSPIAMYELMLPVQTYGVSLMSLGFLVEDQTPIVWRGPMLHKALTQFVDDVHWGDLDVLVLDLPPGTGDVTLSVLELLPEVSLIVVTTPQQAARTVASRVGAMARDSHVPLAGIVENMSELVCSRCGDHTPLFGEGRGQLLADELGAPLLGKVPLDAALRKAGDAGIPVVVGEPDSSSARALVEVSSALRPVRRSLVGLSLGLSPV